MSDELNVNLKSIAARELKNGNAELAAILDGCDIAITRLRARVERQRKVIADIWDMTTDTRLVNRLAEIERTAHEALS